MEEIEKFCPQGCEELVKKTYKMAIEDLYIDSFARGQFMETTLRTFRPREELRFCDTTVHLEEVYNLLSLLIFLPTLVLVLYLQFNA